MNKLVLFLNIFVCLVQALLISYIKYLPRPLEFVFALCGLLFITRQIGCLGHDE